MNNTFGLLYLLGLTFFITTNADHLRRHECPSNIPTSILVSKYEETCLQIVTERTSWTEAREYCQRFGGDLVRVNSVDKQNFIMLQLRRNAPDKVWIGASDQVVESKWIWVTGDGVQKHYQNWKSGEGPNHKGLLFSSAMSEDCALLNYHDRGQWEDHLCSSKFFNYNFICEYDQIGTTTLRIPELKTSTHKLTSSRSQLTLTSKAMQHHSKSTTEYTMPSTRNTIQQTSTGKAKLQQQTSSLSSLSSLEVIDKSMKTTTSKHVPYQPSSSSLGFSEKIISTKPPSFHYSNGTKGKSNGLMSSKIIWISLGVVAALLL